MPPNRRKWILPLLLFLIIPIIATVYAHPGALDGTGGHTDHSTGEYHYHHGYPGHDHYDMDGNGTVDCPYDFKDRTSQNSGSDSGATIPNSFLESLLSKNETRPTTVPPTETLPPAQSTKSENNWETVFEYIIPIAFLVVLVIPAMIYTAVNYHPTDLMGTISQIFLWLIVGCVSILSPLSILIYFLFRILTKPKENKTTVPSVPAPTPQEIQPTAKTIEQNVYTDADPFPVPNSCSRTSYRECRLIWLAVFLFCKENSILKSKRTETYLWTLFFYIVTKHIRKQDIVDQIYAEFPETAISYYNTNSDYVTGYSAFYHVLRERLIQANIDPRTESGLTSLWNFVAPMIHLESQMLLSSFKSISCTLIHYTSQFYPLAHSSDSNERFSVSNTDYNSEIPT